MARVAEHLGLSELEERFRTAKDPILARHVQVIWLLAQGHTSAEVSTVTSFVPRWIAGELGLASVCVQRGWEALRAIEWSIQKPRPRHPKAATPEEESTFKKNYAGKVGWHVRCSRAAK